MEISDLNKIILPKILGCDKRIVNIQTESLTAPGENYGSIMVALTITMEDNKTKKQQVIHSVAKKVPEMEYLLKIFRPDTTFPKEFEFYRTIIPTLQGFQRENGIENVLDIFPDYQGGRLGIQDPNQFDFKAILLLNNLKVEGYKNYNRLQGFNLNISKLILRNLAKFHAVPLALKLKKPEVFEAKVKQFLKRYISFPYIEETQTDRLLKKLVEVASEDSDCQNILGRLKAAVDYSKSAASKPKNPNGIYATLAHWDFWVNNILIDKTDSKVKFVDFQFLHYDTVGIDLSFFLFMSVENSVLVNNYEELLQEYFATFIATLKELHVDTSAYTIENLKDSISEAFKEDTLFQCAFMLDPIFAPTGGLDVQRDNATFGVDNVTVGYREKVWILVKELAKRNII